MAENFPPVRAPWPPEFPDVVTHTDVRTRDAHPAYAAAKSGDGSAAIDLAGALLREGAVDSLLTFFRRPGTILLPVVADEEAGFNAISDGMAWHLQQRLGLEVSSGSVVQTNKVGHTRAILSAPGHAG